MELEFNSKPDIIPLENRHNCDGEIPFETKFDDIKIEIFGTEKCEIFIDGNNGFIFLCTICDLLIPNLEEFGAHIYQSHYEVYYRNLNSKTENNNENNSISVSSCKKNISIISDDNDIEMQLLDDYIKEEELDKRNILISTSSDTSKKRNKKKNYICKICDAAFFNQKILDSHMIYDHKPPDPFYELAKLKNQPDLLSQDSEKEESRKTDLEKKVQDPLQCRYCDRRLKSRKERAEHECIHTGERLYKCDICKKCFRVQKLLNKHMTIHNGVRERFGCELCDSTFTDKSNLLVHIRMHKGDKKYKCNYCEKLFLQNNQRRTHERIHTGEKPFQCNTCGKCFTTSGKLSAHNKRHSGIKPHKCEKCDKSFYSKNLLKNHFVIHTNERPFICEICNATFQRIRTLRAHQKLHSDVAEYVCKICGKGFKQRPGLYSHMKSH